MTQQRTHSDQQQGEKGPSAQPARGKKPAWHAGTIRAALFLLMRDKIHLTGERGARQALHSLRRRLEISGCSADFGDKVPDRLFQNELIQRDERKGGVAGLQPDSISCGHFPYECFDVHDVYSRR